MFTRYNGDRSTIDALKKEIENNWLDVSPQDPIDGEDFWQGEERVNAAITALYIDLRDYEHKQMLLGKKTLIDCHPNRPSNIQQLVRLFMLPPFA